MAYLRCSLFSAYLTLSVLNYSVKLQFSLLTAVSGANRLLMTQVAAGNRQPVRQVNLIMNV